MARKTKSRPANRNAAPETGAGDAPAAKKKADGGAGRAARARELAEALRGLRLSLRECAERYLTETDARIVAALARLEGTAGSEDKRALPGPGASRELAREIKSLGLKPEKGRVKDLGRIRRVVDRATDVLDEA